MFYRMNGGQVVGQGSSRLPFLSPIPSGSGATALVIASEAQQSRTFEADRFAKGRLAMIPSRLGELGRTNVHRKPSTPVKPSRSKSTGPRTHTRQFSHKRGAAPEERLLTIGEVARILHVGRTLVYSLIQSGGLPGLHIQTALRFRLRDVQDYIQRASGDLKGVP